MERRVFDQVLLDRIRNLLLRDEIGVDSIARPRGMDIPVVTSATNDDEGRALLRALGFPFKEN